MILSRTASGLLSADFDYDLPASAIAQQPRPRGSSRLLVLPRDGGPLGDVRFADLPAYLRAGDVLVVNDTRVFPARLPAERSDGRRFEILLVEPSGDHLWAALVKPGRKAKPGDVLAVGPAQFEVVETLPGGGKLLRSSKADVWDLAETHGVTPLPPYIKRPFGDRAAADRESYQTVFARHRGSIAAPTAGIHFTPALLAELADRGVETWGLTLHIGTGTFKPVKTARPEEHRMDPEWYRIPASTVAALARARRRGGRIVAVGTTVVRALEAAAAVGELQQLWNDGGQGVRREGEPDIEGHDGEGRDIEGRDIEGRTAIFIMPGHTFRAVDALVTNFHLPRSTLLMLVSAFADRGRVLAAYRHALSHGYLFYSYGDAMLIS